MKFTHIPADDDSVDGEYRLTGTRIYIQDCKSYTGYYQVNADYLDCPHGGYVLHLEQFPSLRAAKAYAQSVAKENTL